MLYLRHSFAALSLPARFRQEELRSQDLVVVHATHRGGLFDEAADAAAEKSGAWSNLRFVLEGRVAVSTPRGDVVLEASDLALSSAWEAGRCYALEGSTRYLLVAWKHSSVAGDPAVRSEIIRGCDLRGRGGAAQSAHDLAALLQNDASALAVQASASRLLASLSRVGFAVAPDAVRAVGTSIDPAHERFARAVEATLFPLAARPMAIDLQHKLDVGERQTLRLAAEYFKRVHVTVDGWREYVRTMRLEMAYFLATNPHATTELVSREVGFSSPVALCHAFQSRGLPTPGALRSHAFSPERRVPRAGPSVERLALT